MDAMTLALGAPSIDMVPTAYAIPPLVTAVAMLALGWAVVVREQASREAQRFFVLTFTVFVWQACFAAMYAAPDARWALWWARAAYFGIPLIPPAIYDFSTHLLRLRRRRVVWAGWLVGLLFSTLFQVSDRFVAGVYHYEWGWYPRLGSMGTPYLAYFCGFLLLAMVEYGVRLARERSARFRERIGWLMLSFGIAYLGAFDYLAAYGVGLYPFGYVPVLVFLSMVAWALRRYRLVDLTPSFASEQILATMADPLIVADSGGRIRIANEAVSTVLGYGEDALLGRPLASLAVDVAELGRLLSLETVRATEMRLRAQGGEEVEVSVSASPLAGEGGVRVGTVLIARDIRERKRAEVALRHSEEQLRQAHKMEAVGRLAGGIAHDFNNLLTVINGNVELVRASALAEEDAEMLAEVLQAGNRAAGLTRQLLAFSRKQVLQPEVLDLNLSVRALENMLRRLIGEDVELEVRTPPGLGRIRADPGQIEQVVLNLVVNARDSMPAGGRVILQTAEVELGDWELPGSWRARPGTYVRLSVEDNGHGISPEVQERIFEPFFTTKENGKGTGLGLATVYGIVNQSGGHIYVESQEGQGTAFHVLMPRVADEVTPRAAQPAAPSLAGAETVLVVEDDSAVRTLTRQILRRHGYAVIEAANGAEALEVARAHLGPIHLLLTDVVMPGMNGRVLADLFAGARPEARVLFMSGYTDGAIARHGIVEDGITLLQKPFSPDTLAERVREVLDAVSPARALG
jgi:PAS domain S-box-containing protein